MSNVENIIKESFGQYAGAVLQSRALVDVRDACKPSFRQVMYCLYTDKFTHDKPFKKTLKAIGSGMRVYIHGDASLEGIIMRAGQPFAYRYPMIEVEGSYGNLMESGNWAAPRYTASRLSKVTENLFNSIERGAVTDWRDNYDDTEKYPGVLPSLGFYNIVNGTLGIGVGLASSIPPFNLTEVNNALIKLLWDENTPIEEVICLPDFPTGGILLNKDEVIESLKMGAGKSCRIRSLIEFDAKSNVLTVKEIPYAVYTNTICRELEKLLEENPLCGIDRFNDLTGKEPNLKIYLKKNANAEKVIKLLYKETSLQSYYSINMTMLKDGRTPKVFNWKEALLEHLEYEKVCYKRAFEYDLNKLSARLHIVDGIIKAISIIKEVIDCIKNSKSTSDAKDNLIKEFNFSELQAKAILEIKLARLANLEIAKYTKEKSELEEKISYIKTILSDETLFKKEIEKGFVQVRDSYGDARRTKILNLTASENDDSPIEERKMVLVLTNFNNIYSYEESTLVICKRGGAGTKVKLSDGEFILQTINGSNQNNLLMFSSKGKVYSTNIDSIASDSKVSLSSLVDMDDGESIVKIASDEFRKEYQYVIFATKNGLVKKTLLSEYDTKRNKGIVAIKLKDGDSLIGVDLINAENIALASSNGNIVIFNSEEVSPTGRATSGVIGIKLKSDSEAVSLTILKNCDKIITASKNGFVKITEQNEFSIGSRANVGVCGHKLKEGDTLVSTASIPKGCEEIIAISNSAIIKMPVNDINTLSRTSNGTRLMKLKDNEIIKGVMSI